LSHKRPARASEPPKRLTRRDFMATSVCAAAAGVGGLLAGCARQQQEAPAVAPQAGPAPPAPPPAPEVTMPVSPPPTRTLGRTGLKVSILSMGGIGGETGLLQAGLAKGINFIHSAMGYGTLDRVGEAISGQRDRVLLGIKYERRGTEDWDYLNRSLEALQVDYVDILFFPLNSPDEARDRKHLEFFRKVKKQNKARFIGLTSHSSIAPTCQTAVGAGFWDVIMPSYVPDPEACAALRPVLDQAGKKNLGVVAMKTMAGIERTAMPEMQTRLKEVIAQSSVTTVVKGMLTFQQLDGFLQAAVAPLKRAESQSLKAHLASRRGQVCSLCGACPPCPRGVDVFEVMRAFDYYHVQQGRPPIARAMYHQIPSGQRGSACDDCGKCAGKCPSGLNIARQVRAADLILG
jgi:predicted aldo/keto reductase-like oxidoreductase